MDKRRYQIYHQGQMEATIRAKSAREAAKAYFAANPGRQTCTVGEPGQSDDHWFERGADFESNRNRVIRKS